MLTDTQRADKEDTSGDGKSNFSSVVEHEPHKGDGMITYSQMQSIASDVEFASVMITPAPDIDEHEPWWMEAKDGEIQRERVRVARSLQLAAEILNHLTIEQVEALPTYLRAA